MARLILFGRDRRPVGDTVRTVMGIKGEPATPDDPAQGLVWRTIVTQVDRAGSESAYVSTTDTPRETFAKHPWSIGGGGVSELKEAIESMTKTRLSQRINSIGFMAITGEDEAYQLPQHRAIRMRYPVRQFIIGDMVRDWLLDQGNFVLFPYVLLDRTFLPADVDGSPRYVQHRWNLRTHLCMRSMFRKSAEEHGFRWDQYMQFIDARVGAQYLITFAFVATHNHFVLDRGGKVFNRSAPVIKLPPGATEDAHLGLLGLLNSSVACFWLKQVAHNKGSTVDDKGARQRTSPFEDFYEFTGTQLLQFPLIDSQPLDLARKLETLACELTDTLPAALFAQGDVPFRAQGQRGGQTPDPGAAPPSTTDSPPHPGEG